MKKLTENTIVVPLTISTWVTNLKHMSISQKPRSNRMCGSSEYSQTQQSLFVQEVNGTFICQKTLLKYFCRPVWPLQTPFVKWCSKTKSWFSKQEQELLSNDKITHSSSETYLASHAVHHRYTSFNYLWRSWMTF